MSPSRTRPRAAAAVIRSESQEILMVKHRWRDGTASWILPGGALMPGEKPEQAALRELEEETSLKGTLIRFLFSLPYNLGTSEVFLVEVDPEAKIALGYDPEEAHKAQKMLEDVAWFPIQAVKEHAEVKQVLLAINWQG